jgi:hypothetical protein
MTLSARQAEALGNALVEQAWMTRESQRRATTTPLIYRCRELSTLEPSQRSFVVGVAKEFVKKNWWPRYALRNSLLGLAMLLAYSLLGVEWGSMDFAHGSLGRLRGGTLMLLFWIPFFLFCTNSVYVLYVRRKVRRFAAELLSADSVTN